MNTENREIPLYLKLPRVSGLSPGEFREQYVIPGKPAIIKDAIDDWAALTKWTPEFWKENYGEREVSIDERGYTVEQVIDLALESKPDSPAPYYRNIRIRHDFAELMADISPYPPLCGPNWFHSLAFYPVRERIVGGGGHYELFIGGAGRSFPFLHFDAPGAHTFIHQIAGKKKFILFAPSDSDYLYPMNGKKFSVSSIADIENVDLEQFPLYAKASKYEDEVGPGDTLFMPAGWWHTALMKSFSISLGIDVVNDTNWDSVYGYMKKRASYENAVLASIYMAAMASAGLMARALSK